MKPLFQRLNMQTDLRLLEGRGSYRLRADRATLAVPATGKGDRAIFEPSVTGHEARSVPAIWPSRGGIGRRAGVRVKSVGICRNRRLGGNNGPRAQTRPLTAERQFNHTSGVPAPAGMTDRARKHLPDSDPGDVPEFRRRPADTNHRRPNCQRQARVAREMTALVGLSVDAAAGEGVRPRHRTRHLTLRINGTKHPIFIPCVLRRRRQPGMSDC